MNACLVCLYIVIVSSTGHRKKKSVLHDSQAPCVSKTLKCFPSTRKHIDFVADILDKNTIREKEQ